MIYIEIKFTPLIDISSYEIESVSRALKRTHSELRLKKTSYHPQSLVVGFDFRSDINKSNYLKRSTSNDAY